MSDSGKAPDIRRAVAAHQAGDLSAAAAIYEAILQTEPDHFDALHMLGVVRYQQNALDEALRLLMAAAERKPQSPAALSNRGLVLAKLRRVEEAIASYDAAIALKPDYAEAYNNRGLALIELEHFEEGLASCDAAIGLKSDYAEAHVNRARALRALQRPQDALASLDRAIALRANFADAWLSKAIMLRQGGRLEEALVCLDRAADCRGPKGGIAFHRGLTLAALSRERDAIAALDMALAASGVTLVEASSTPVEAVPKRIVTVTGRSGSRPASTAADRRVVVTPMRMSQLADIAHDWRELADHALEPNVFLEPDFALPAIEAYRIEGTVLTAWSAQAPRRLLGLLPLHHLARHARIPWPVTQVWQPPHAASAAPLLHRDGTPDTLDALLTFIAGSPLPNLVLFPPIAEDGPFALLLRRTIAQRGDRLAMYCRFQRAFLAPTGVRDDYVNLALTGERRKKLRWLWRQLEKLDRIETTSITDARQMPAAVADYFAVEASGWKGRAGTAAALRPELKRLTESALCRLAESGKARIDRIAVDGRPIAATIMLSSGSAGWLWKTSYDEEFARFSPGFFNVLHLTEAILGETSIVSVDSSTVPDHSMIDRLWREKGTIGFCMLGLGPDARDKFDVAFRIEGYSYQTPPYYDRTP